MYTSESFPAISRKKIWRYIAPMLIMIGLVSCSLITTTLILGAGIRTAEKTSYEEVEGNFTSFVMVKFNNVDVVDLFGKRLKRDIWVTTTDPDDTRIDVKIDREIGTTPRISITPTLEARVVYHSQTYDVKHVTVWVSDETSKAKWEEWINEQLQKFIRRKGI